MIMTACDGMRVKKIRRAEPHTPAGFYRTKAFAALPGAQRCYQAHHAPFYLVVPRIFKPSTGTHRYQQACHSLSGWVFGLSPCSLGLEPRHSVSPHPLLLPALLSPDVANSAVGHLVCLISGASVSRFRDFSSPRSCGLSLGFHRVGQGQPKRNQKCKAHAASRASEARRSARSGLNIVGIRLLYSTLGRC